MTPPAPSVSQCRLIPLDRHDAPDGACLIPVEPGISAPFECRRVFAVRGARAGSTRGGHANAVTCELLMCLHGAVEVVLSDGTRTVVFTLAEPDVGLLITPGVWVEERVLRDDTVLMALCDTTWAQARSAYERDRAAWEQALRVHAPA